MRSKLIEAVLTKQVAAGAISDDDYAGLDEKRKSEMVILAETEKLPRHLVSVRIDLAPQTVGKLNDLLVAMHDDAEGQRILKKTDQTTKFDPLPGGEAALKKRLLDSFYTPAEIIIDSASGCLETEQPILITVFVILRFAEWR